MTLRKLGFTSINYEVSLKANYVKFLGLFWDGTAGP